MKTIVAFCAIILGFSSAYSQSAQPTPDPDKVYTVVQQKPNFSGDINKFLVDNIKYPEDARKKNIEGTVYVQFVVERDGSVSTVNVLRGADKLLDDEAVRVVSIMPKWTPGSQDGVPVRVQYVVPIHFKLK
jgi:TonB family protein